MTDPSRIDTPDAERHAALEDEAVNRIVGAGPSGAVAVAGVATLIVVAMVVTFYLFVYLPRGVLQ